MDVRDEMFWPGLAYHRLGSLFSSPPWIEALIRTYGFGISAAARVRNGTVGDTILFSHVSDLRGERLLCLPFSDYCDPLVEDNDAWNEVIAPLLKFEVPISLRCLNTDIPINDPRFAMVGRAMWHAVDLDKTEEALWAGLSGSARQNIRRAERDGVVVRESRDLEAVRAFHRLHCYLRKIKYRLLAQPIAFFENLHEAFAPSEQLTVLLAEIDEVPVAGIFFLEWKDALYYKFNASSDQQSRPNDLLVWEGIRLARQRGLARMDFGLSDLGQPGLIRYKRKFATQEKAIILLRWQPPGYADRRGEQIGMTFGRITHMLTDPGVPDEITRAASDELYRYFC